MPPKSLDTPNKDLKSTSACQGMPLRRQQRNLEVSITVVLELEQPETITIQDKETLST